MLEFYRKKVWYIVLSDISIAIIVSSDIEGEGPAVSSKLLMESFLMSYYEKQNNMY